MTPLPEGAEGDLHAASTTKHPRLAALDRLVDARRVRVYAAMLLAAQVVALIWLSVSLRHGLDAQGKPLGADFIIFYGTSLLTLAGKATQAYVPGVLMAAERVAAPASRGLFYWAYPPTLQLLIWPLALAPYRIALAIWSALGLAGYLATIRRISADRRAWLLALAFPGVFLDLAQGQTGLITTTFMGGGLLLLDRRPYVAGGLIGLLAMKPHLAVLLPLLLLVSGRWRSVIGAALSSVGLSAIATAAFGAGIWRAFLASSGTTWRGLSGGYLPLDKVPSTFAALLRLGAPADIALAVHALLALAAAVLAVDAWRRPGSLELKAGVAVIATLIVLPYAFDYDLALLAIPIGVGVKSQLERPTIPGARVALALLALSPVFLSPVSLYLGVPLEPAVLWGGLLALLAMVRLQRLGSGSVDRADPACRHIA